MKRFRFTGKPLVQVPTPGFAELEQRVLASGAEREPVERMTFAEKYGSIKTVSNSDRSKAHAWFIAHGEGVRDVDERHTRACDFVQLMLDEHEIVLQELEQRVQYMLNALTVIVESGNKPDRAVARLGMAWPPPDANDVETIERIAPRETVKKEEVLDLLLERIEDAQMEAIKHGLSAEQVMYTAFATVIQNYADGGVTLDSVKEQAQKVYETRAKNRPGVH